MVPFPDSEPVDVSPGHILPLVGFTKVGEQGPDPPLLTAHIDISVPMMLIPSPWGRGDPPASIMGKLPCPLGKTKPRQRAWHQVCNVSVPEFQNALQITRALQPTEGLNKQHAIVSHMSKHEK